MKRTRLLLLCAGMLATLLLVVPSAPVVAQLQTAYRYNYSHSGLKGLLQGTDIPQAVDQAALPAAISPIMIAADPVVEAVMFWQDGCPHCHEVLENTLPPLVERYGEQFELLLIEVSNMEDVTRLFEVAALYGIPREKVFIPFLIIGDYVLIGSGQVPAELPGLIELYLEQGGVSRPDIPNLAAFKSVTRLSPGLIPEVVVEMLLFQTSDCHSCQLIKGQVLAPLQEQYGRRLVVEEIAIVTSVDLEYLDQVAAGYGLDREQVDLPMILIGEHALIGEQILVELPGLVDGYFSTGGVAAPAPPPRAGEELVQPADEMRSNGFILAVVVLASMVLSLLYALGRLVLGVLKEERHIPRPTWQAWLIPALCVIGLGVAGYLSYVEITYLPAMCGPVGDCNTVQQSPYARLWGVLPIGVLGMAGYVAILVAWWVGRKKWGWISSQAPLALFGMTFFGTVFSVYLTYLELFVIKAVCIWCITSAILMTLLLFLSLPPAMENLVGDLDSEDESE